MKLIPLIIALGKAILFLLGLSLLSLVVVLKYPIAFFVIVVLILLTLTLYEED